MIIRLVLFKLRPSARGRREAIATEARAALSALPGVRAVRPAVPADAGAEVWDVLVEILFDDLAAAERCTASPAYRAFVDQLVMPLAEVHKAWNFAVSG